MGILLHFACICSLHFACYCGIFLHMHITAMSSGILLHFALIGEDSVQTPQHNVRSVDNLRMTAFAIPAMYLRAIPTSPLQESIAVQEDLLIDDLERQAMALRVVHRLHLKWRAQ